MSDLILHHHDPSPYAEKIRKSFGIKSLAWRSVQVPMAPPKPDLTALTGGYRGAPVLQIGADVYCDTALIIRTIERLHPSPSLFETGPAVAFAVQHWGDVAVFRPGAALSLHENAERIPGDVSEDRAAYFSFLDVSRFAEDAPHFRSKLRANARLVEAQLSDGRAFMTGDRPQWVDVSAYFNVWMAGGNIPSSERLFADMPRLHEWRARIDAIGCGARTEIDAAEAIDVARNATPLEVGASRPDESGCAPGDAVAVSQVGFNAEPVLGTLASVDDDEIVVRRTDPRAGDVAVRFPRLGYRLSRRD